MVDQLKADLSQGLEASRGIPAWLMIALMFGLPGGSALMTSRLQGNETTTAIEHLREELKAEVNERKAFEVRCNQDRSKLDERLSSFTVDLTRQQMMLERVAETQKTLLAQVSVYQDGMMRLVRNIDDRMNDGWATRKAGAPDGG